MARKIRLGYDILSKRAIETESGINIDEALKRKGQQIIDLGDRITNIDGNIENVISNFDCVYIDPDNGDDSLDGLTRNTAVKYLKRAAEIYIDRFGGRDVKACVINTHGPASTYEKANDLPAPGDTSNLWLSEILNIDSVYLYGDGGICLSNLDYQDNSESPELKNVVSYNVKAHFKSGIGLYLHPDNDNYWKKGIEAISDNGDIYLTGSYDKELEYLKLIAKEGTVLHSLGPAFNTMAGVTCDYFIDAHTVLIYSPLCGKNATIISRHTRITGAYSALGYLWIKNDVYIYSAGYTVWQNYGFIGGRLRIKTLEGSNHPKFDFYNAINGHGNDDTFYNPDTPESCTFPDIDIDWEGEIGFVGDVSCKNLHIKCEKFYIYSSNQSRILSQNDIIIEADHFELGYEHSTSNYFYCLGKMIFRSPNEIKIAQYLYTDELLIDAGGRPNDYPISYSSYQYPYWSITGVTGTSDVHCKITNQFECIIGGADPVLSTNEAHYFIKCSGDYADQWFTITNGNAIVSLEVGGHAYLSGNGCMIVKRLVLESKSAFITNTGIYASSFDIKTGQLFWNNSGYLNQWVGLAETSWSISPDRSWGASWSNDFEDRSSLNCDSLEQLTSTTFGFVHPGYGQKRHDWDINIKVLVPYRINANYYGGGAEYAVVLGYIYQGSFNGSIAGEIGDVLVTDQKQSPYSHDWIFPYYYQSYYENNKFGNNITLHIAHRKWHHVYIDMDQGSDAYDGMSKETPVKSTYGLDKVFKQMLYPSYVTIHICGSMGNGNRGSALTTYGPYDSIDFSYTLDSFTGGLLYNWYAVSYLRDNSASLGIPENWRVPTKNDFAALTSFTNGKAKLRLPYLIGTDDYGFSDVAQYGYSIWSSNMNFESKNGIGFWTADSYDSSRAWQCDLDGGYSYPYKYNICPIRLVRDNTEGEETGTTGTIEIGGETYNTVVIGTQVWITRNLDYKFDGGTYRTDKDSNYFTQSSTPQYGYEYYRTNSSLLYSMNDNPVYDMPYLLTIVADDPYLSATVKGPIKGWNNTPSMLKMYGFHTLNVLDCFAYVTDLQASVDLYYVAYTSTQQTYPKTSILRLRGGNVYTMGIAAGYNTSIEADNNYRCLSRANNTGSGNAPGFYGATYIHAKYIDFTGNQCTFASGICGSLIADTGFRFGTPIKFEYGSLSIIANGSGNISIDQAGNLPDSSNTTRCYFGIGNWTGVGNISLICPNQDLYIYTIGQSERTNGRLHIEANDLTLYGSTYGCDVDIRTNGNITFGANIFGEGGRASLVNIYCGGTISGGWGTRACNLKLNARKLDVPVVINNSSNSYYDTTIYVNTEYAANGVFGINDPVNGNYNLFARVVELAGPFYVYVGNPPLTNDGSYIKKFKGLISFYTGNDPDTDLADFTEIAPNADFELIVLNRSKQLVAGKGITISDTGDQVVIAAKNTGSTEMVEIPVIFDSIDPTQCSASLVLNKYNIITGLDDSITDMSILVPEPAAHSLREVGFEFTPDSGTCLSGVNFYSENGSPFYDISPEEYFYGCVYQGAVINSCVTLVEYGDPVEPEPEGLVIDGRTYRTVTMPDGNEWMAENLAASSFGGVCYNDGTDDSYGLYYTVEEVANISVPGWHVATLDEWNGLVQSVDSNYTKLASTDEWSYPGTSVTIHGTDDYGFTFCPYGLEYSYMDQTVWHPIGVFGSMWLSNGTQIGAVGIQVNPSTEGFEATMMPTVPDGQVYLQNVRLVKDK